MAKQDQKRVRVEFYLLAEDLAVLDEVAEEHLTTRGDLIRAALFAHYPFLQGMLSSRTARAFERALTLLDREAIAHG